MSSEGLSWKDLEALPERSVVQDIDQDVWQKYDGEWYAYPNRVWSTEKLERILSPITLVKEEDIG